MLPLRCTSFANIIHKDQNPPDKPVLDPRLRKELKLLINEVLDEREHQKKLNGPYDVYENENESDEWLYRGTY